MIDKDAFLNMLKQRATEIAMQEEHVPMLVGVNHASEGSIAFLGGIPKGKRAEVVRAFVSELRPKYYAFVSEAYMAKVDKSNSSKFERIEREGVHSLPADDRYDILMVVLCENNGKARLFIAKVHPENTGVRVVGAWEESGDITQMQTRHLVLRW